MAGQRVSTNSVVWLVVVAGLLMVGNSVAQPPGTPTLPNPVPNTLPVPQIPQVTPSPASTGGPGFTGSGGPGGPIGPGVGSGPQPAPASFPPTPRFEFKIDPNAPVKDLFPTPPKVKPVAGPILTDDLTKVPEAEFQARPEKVTNDGKLTEQVAYQLAKINHLNAKKTDAFMVALVESRADLAGLPFAMGDDCRTSGERTKQFTIAVNTVRQALNGSQGVSPNSIVVFTGGQAPPPSMPQAQRAVYPFWPHYTGLCDQEDAARSRTEKELTELVAVARIAALMQMLAA